MNWAFSSWQAFFSMGGRAVFVWWSIGLTIAALVLLFVLEFARHRQLSRALAAQEREV